MYVCVFVCVVGVVLYIYRERVRKREIQRRRKRVGEISERVSEGEREI